MAKNMHEENKSAKKVSVVPCLLMIIFLPFILLYLLFTLLFVPIDYLIFKRSRYHRDFGGSYSFLSGAHPDNALYTLVKEHSLPILYAKGGCAYEAEGFFFYRKLLIAAHADLFFKDGKWLVHTADADMPLDEATGGMLSAAAMLPGVKCERVLFLLRERTARRAGEAALAAAHADGRIATYKKSTLKGTLDEIIAKESL